MQNWKGVTMIAHDVVAKAKLPGQARLKTARRHWDNLMATHGYLSGMSPTRVLGELRQRPQDEIVSFQSDLQSTGYACPELDIDGIAGRYTLRSLVHLYEAAGSPTDSVH